MKFNAVTIIGLVLAALGVAFLLGVGIPGSETVSAGPLSATVDTERAVHPAISVILLVAGIVGVGMGQKQG